MRRAVREELSPPATVTDSTVPCARLRHGANLRFMRNHNRAHVLGRDTLVHLEPIHPQRDGGFALAAPRHREMGLLHEHFLVVRLHRKRLVADGVARQRATRLPAIPAEAERQAWRALPLVLDTGADVRLRFDDNLLLAGLSPAAAAVVPLAHRIELNRGLNFRGSTAAHPSLWVRERHAVEVLNRHGVRVGAWLTG